MTKDEKRKAYQKAWYHKNKEKKRGYDKVYCERNKEKRKERSHKGNLERSFGLSVEQYEEMLKAQGGVCAICRSRPDKKRLGVGHCHRTGAVRGLLCHSCNVGLGLFKDSAAVLASATTYLSGTECLF